MGKTKNEEQGPREQMDFKAENKSLLRQYYEVAKEMMAKAVELSKEKDFRSSEDRPGLGVVLHMAQKAADEIVRLSPLCGVLESEALPDESAFAGESIGWGAVSKTSEAVSDA
jgi:hypothetical protein